MKNAPKRPNIFRVLRDSVLILMNLAVVILLLLSAKMSVLSPERSVLSSYPNYAFLPLAFINLFFVLYWALRKSVWFLMSLLSLLLCLPEQKAWFPVKLIKEQKKEDKTIKVLTYNTMQFSSYRSHVKQDPNPVIRYLQESEADVLCLQEAGYSFDKQLLEKTTVITALKDYPYHSLEIIQSNKYRTSNLWVFSKYPILKSGRLAYKSRSNASHYCDIKIGQDTLRFINNHLESNKLTKEDMALYKIIVENPDRDNISQVAEKLGRKLGQAARLRAPQAETIAGFIRETPYKLVVCGDFNDIPASYTYRCIKKGLRDAWSQNGRGLGITFHEKFYLFRIDYILHSPELRSYGTKVDHVRYSDHYPVWTYLELP